MVPLLGGGGWIMFPSRPPQNKASLAQRYSYTTSTSSSFRFEQSLDVYRPRKDKKNNAKCCNQDGNDDDDDMIVLLVVGSGWMGHQPWIYLATAWWNAAGPRTVAAALQCPTVCIRHSGAYFDMPSWSTIVLYSVGPCGVVSGLLAYYFEKVIMAACFLPLLVVLLTCACVKWTGQGSASLDDMVDDVATAIAWVQHHPHLVLSCNSKPTTERNGTLPTKIVFGGYSSGGHVAATLLQRPTAYFSSRGLPPPHKLFAAILYISGVLAVRPIDDGDYTKTRIVNDSDPQTVCTSDSSSTNGGLGSFSSHDDDKSKSKHPIYREHLVTDKHNNSQGTIVFPDDFRTSDHRTTTTQTTWLTNLVCRTVWGPDWRQTLSSPLEKLLQGGTESTKLAQIPHLLIENRREIPFGLPQWLDAFFCASAYRQALLQLQQEYMKNNSAVIKLSLVESDHWNILASRHLYQAIQKELPPLLVTANDKKM